MLLRHTTAKEIDRHALTINPAKILQLDHRKGLIKAAYDADITILDDNYDVVSTMILGKVVYNR